MYHKPKIIKNPGYGNQDFLLKYIKYYEHHKYIHNLFPHQIFPYKFTPGMPNKYIYPRVVKWFIREVVMGPPLRTPPLAALGLYPL
jgi:hypothetical protein